MAPVTVRFSELAVALGGIAHWPAIVNERLTPAERGGPPYGPVDPRVSRTRQGATVK